MGIVSFVTSSLSMWLHLTLFLNLQIELQKLLKGSTVLPQAPAMQANTKLLDLRSNKLREKNRRCS